MPSRLADEAEIAALVGTLAEHGRGLFMLTKGGHTRMDFLERLAAESGRPVVVAALLHSSTAPDAVFADMRAIADANARGHRLVGAVSCCPLSMDFTLRSPYTFEGLTAWQEAQSSILALRLRCSACEKPRSAWGAVGAVDDDGDGLWQAVQWVPVAETPGAGSITTLLPSGARWPTNPGPARVCTSTTSIGLRTR